jgi:3-oxoacyl-[acyl-carrier-protein] synthase-1
MKRAVITGIGIISCLGNDRKTVSKSLREGISGIRHREDFAEMGLKCNVGAVLDIDPQGSY